MGSVAMRLVRQLGDDGESGCGIACLAMLAKTDYKTTKKRLNSWPRDNFGCWEPRGTTKKQMLLGLRRFGIVSGKPRRIAQKRYKDFEFDAVLLGYLNGELHWTVWDSARGGRLLDPYRTKGGRQFKFRCTSFIPIKARSGRKRVG